MGWMIGVRSLTGAEDFSSSPCVQTGSGAHPASYPMGAGGPFPGGKERPGCDADHSPPFSPEVKYEKKLHLLSPHVLTWHVAGQLLFPAISSKECNCRLTSFSINHPITWSYLCQVSASPLHFLIWFLLLVTGIYSTL
jgi:hypothetical protein